MQSIQLSSKFTRTAAGLLVALSALALAGCGGGGGDEAAATAPASSASGGSSAPTAPPAPTTPAPVPATNRAPTISGTAPGAINANSAYSFTPAANDADQDTLTFSIQNKPSWATFATTTGKLSGTPDAGDVGVYSNIGISVSDGKTSVSLGSFSVAVNAISNGRVTLNWDAPTENTDGSPLTNLTGYKIYYGTSASALNQSINVSTAGVQTYVVENLSAATWYFAITAVSASGVESSFSNVANKTI